MQLPVLSSVYSSLFPTSIFRWSNLYMFCLCEGDCHDARKHQDRCVTGAILNYTMQLMSASENSQSIVHCEWDFGESDILASVWVLWGSIQQWLVFVCRQLDRGSHVLITLYGRCSPGNTPFAIQMKYHIRTSSIWVIHVIYTALACWFPGRWRWKHDNSPMVPSQNKFAPCKCVCSLPYWC